MAVTDMLHEDYIKCPYILPRLRESGVIKNSPMGQTLRCRRLVMTWDTPATPYHNASLSPGYIASNTAFPLMCLGSTFWHEYLCLCHPHGIPGWSSKPLCFGLAQPQLLWAFGE